MFEREKEREREYRELRYCIALTAAFPFCTSFFLCPRSLDGMEAGKGWAGRSVVIAKLGRRFDFDEILKIGLRSIPKRWSFYSLNVLTDVGRMTT